MDFVGKAGPGPGEYEPYDNYAARAENLNAKEEPVTVKYEANIPRYHESIAKDQEKKV